MKDLVSVIMPAYNTARFIGESIRSVQAQTYPYWELIIVDDCSTDGTEAAVRPFLLDKRIIYLKNQENQGAALCRNRALARAGGRWMAFLDSDDLWLPEKLERQIRFMESQNCHFSYTNYREMDQQGRRNGKIVTGPRRICRRGMYGYCWMGCLTVMYDAQWVGLIQIENIQKNNDYALWLRVCRKADCLLLAEDLAKYRKRTGSISDQGYGKLIRWHYRLFRRAEKKGVVAAVALTAGNLLLGCWKKIKYVRGDNYADRSGGDGLCGNGHGCAVGPAPFGDSGGYPTGEGGNDQ